MATNVALYNGAVRLTFDEAAHSYAVSIEGGEPVLVPSVTTILKVIDKPALPRWAAKMVCEHLQGCLKPGEALDEIQIANLLKDAKAAPWRRADDAANIGTIVHSFAEEWALGNRPPPPINPQARNAADAFVAWWEGADVHPVVAERKLYSRDYNYAGTVDLVAYVGGDLAIADFKTSTGIWPEYRLQLAAYQQAYEEEFGRAEMDRLCLRFGKDGGFEVGKYTEETMPEDFEAFRAALGLHRWQESIKPKKRRAA